MALDDNRKQSSTCPIISYFCIYNPSLGPSEENTKDQILYYTAKKAVPADVKMKQVGLAQALVNFADAFDASHHVQNVHTQKNRMVFLQPEPGFWIHMCVELGVSQRHVKDNKGKEKLATEYLDTQLNDRALEAVLRLGYEQFKLLHGTFSMALYGYDQEHGSDQPGRQRVRTLMHAIEDFFSEWVWQLDFECLNDTILSAVFNGVPLQPVLRSTYLQIHEINKAVCAQFHGWIDHVMILDSQDFALVYRSPSLDIVDARALRRLIASHTEKYIAEEAECTGKEESLKPKKDKVSSLKAFTRTLSNTHLFNYFTSWPAASRSTPALAEGAAKDEPPALPPRRLSVDATPLADEPPSPSVQHGTYLSGLYDSTGQGDPIILRVFLNSGSSLDGGASDEMTKDTQINDESLTEYYLVIYKHQHLLTWAFLLPCVGEVDHLVSEPSFYINLETTLIEHELNKITTLVTQDMNNTREKSLSLGKHFRCFYYDNATLNMKSTMEEDGAKEKIKESRQSGLRVTNEMLLQMLELKDDFEKYPQSTEIYTRSTLNYWVAGYRVYTRAASRARSREEYVSHDHGSELGDGGSIQSNDDIISGWPAKDDYNEIYLVASRKDTSLADVEDNLRKMTATLLETVRLE